MEPPFDWCSFSWLVSETAFTVLALYRAWPVGSSTQSLRLGKYTSLFTVPRAFCRSAMRRKLKLTCLTNSDYPRVESTA